MKRRAFVKRFSLSLLAARVLGEFPDVIKVPRATVNVMDYGAVGDGMTDDGPAIRRAVASAVEGEVVYFPLGRYNIA